MHAVLHAAHNDMNSHMLADQACIGIIMTYSSVKVQGSGARCSLVKFRQSAKLTGSKMPGPSLLMLAEGSMPKLPVNIEASSDRMSPKMLPVTMVSNTLGLRRSCMAALSMYLRQTGTDKMHKRCIVLSVPYVCDKCWKDS